MKTRVGQPGWWAWSELDRPTCGGADDRKIEESSFPVLSEGDKTIDDRSAIRASTATLIPAAVSSVWFPSRVVLSRV